MHDDRAPQARTALSLAALLALGLATFWPILSNGFVNFDDIRFIRDNPDFNPVTVAGILRYWRGPYFGGAFPATYAFLGTVAAFARGEHGLEPFAFRLAGLLVHLAGAAAVFYVLRLLVRSTVAALVGAALFCVHPLQVEAAAWAVSPYTALSLIAIALYLRAAQLAVDPTPEDASRRRIFYIAATVVFALAMLSKPVAMVCIPMVAALDLAWVRRGRFTDVARSLAVWCALAVPVIIMTKTMIGTPPVAGQPLWARPLVAGDAVAFFLVKTAWPVPLIPDYGRTPEWLRAAGPFSYAWALPAMFTIAALIVWRVRRDPRPLALLVIFVGAMLPVIGLVPHHFQEYSTVADRYAYLPLLAVAIAVAWLVAARWWTALLVAPLILVLAVLSHRQAERWHDTESIFAYTLRVNPDSFAAHRILAYEASQNGDNVLASVHYAAALQVHPDDPTANFNLANAFVDRGDIGGALQHFERALAKKPDDPVIRNNYGVALARLARYRDAEQQFQIILAKHPAYADARRNLAVAQAKARAAASKPASQPASPPAP